MIMEGYVQILSGGKLKRYVQFLEISDDPELVASSRNCDVPAGPDSQTFVLDGFLVTGNVEVKELHNIDTGFAYSDHNPVVMRFVLKQEAAEG